MKRKVFLALLIAVALVLGLSGCKTEADNSFNYAKWAGTWKVVGTENELEPGTYIDFPAGAVPAPLNGWELKVTKKGKFTFSGNLPGIGIVKVNGELTRDPDLPNFFLVMPKDGIFYDEAGEVTGPIPEEAFSAFEGAYINRAIVDGKWTMGGEGTFDVFARKWAK